VTELLIEKPFENADVIFHQAASKKNICLKDPRRDLDVNGFGTLRMLRLAERHNIKKFVHASTGSVYGEVDGKITEDTPTKPVSYYGVSKLAGEGYARLFMDRLNITILRYFHVYGPRQETDPNLGGVVSIFRKILEDDGTITIHGSGEQQRVFTHVSDVVDANIEVWKNLRAKGQIYNCAANKRTTINQLARKLGAERIEYDDPLPGDIYHFDVDSSRIRQLGVRFRNFGD
jgi:nucleoside-diphosphate-sugar epimerase